MAPTHSRDLTLTELIEDQAALRGRISRAEENLRKLGRAKMTPGAIQARINSLDCQWKEYQERHALLNSTFRTELQDTSYCKLDEFESTEEIFITQYGLLQDHASQAMSLNPIVESMAKAEHSHQKPALPKLALPTFSGTYAEWPAFRDLFESVIDKSSSLTNVEKLQYLKVSVKGEAEMLIKNLPTVGTNYVRAFKILQDRYANTRLLVRSSFSQFAALRKMKSDTVSELRRVLNGASDTVNTMESLNRPISSSEDFFVCAVSDLLDNSTRREWELSLEDSTDPPTFAILRAFLERRIHSLEAILPTVPPTSVVGKPSSNSTRVHHVGKRESAKPPCPLCQGSHHLMGCDTYRSKTPVERKGFLEVNKRCLNCLGSHEVAQCPSKKNCLSCNGRHHSSLHDAIPTANGVAKTVHIAQQRFSAGPVLLATVRLLVADKFGNFRETRALIDQGSEASMISASLAQRLRLQRSHASVSIFGVGGLHTSTARGVVTLKMMSRSRQQTATAQALVLPRISSYASSPKAQAESWPHISGLELADPEFARSDAIDVLLGADVCSQIILDGVRKGLPGQPFAQETIFGWIVSGPTGTTCQTQTRSGYHCAVRESLSELVRQFWEQEEFAPREPRLTQDEQACEDFYAKTHSRMPDGRYVVRLPFRAGRPHLPSTYLSAARTMEQNERRFTRDVAMSKLYNEFMTCYEQLNHMSAVPPTAATPAETCHLPHHGVMKGAKLRVVFNGSWRTPSGATLNDSLHVGKNLLPVLSDVLLRWRMHRYVIATDMEKMYRQILVHPDDRDLQRIVWRQHPSDAMTEYRLNTVTYGMACAPFLAIRTLHQLADDEASVHPEGAAILRRDVYVDDVLTGSDCLDTLKKATVDLIKLCLAGGFPLGKWASNSPELLSIVLPPDQVPVDHRAWDSPPSTHATLGLRWHPSGDSFSFSVPPASACVVTKRVVLSQAAQLFDPLGWLTPVTARAKLAIQTTWLLKLDWDCPLPVEETHRWQDFRSQWTELESITVPRLMTGGDQSHAAELHGFADASEKAYAAVLYLKSKIQGQSSMINIIMAKSKVAPLKQVSLPRLELCAAHLLAKITDHVVRLLLLHDTPIHLWSDSTVALSWIQGHPTRWTTFVANRVSEIQRLCPEAQWHHVKGAENPADCASRGISPTELAAHPLWWHGPPFLASVDNYDQEVSTWPDEDLPEQRRTALTADVAPPEDMEFLQRASSYSGLLRLTAWCQRWRQVHIARAPLKTHRGKATPLTAKDVARAEATWIRLVQAHHFPDELRALSQSRTIPHKSPLCPLTPFIDQDGLIRMKGRLTHALLPADSKHLIILPAKSRFTHLLVHSVHRLHLHSGAQLTLAAIRQRFWVLQGRSAVKHCIHRCVTCTRWRAERPAQIMADLPIPRVTATRPFQHAGVDYAGPLLIKVAPGRGHKTTKAFLVVFVCLATKAVHLDVASNYTAEAFLAAFRRFVSRRGPCSELHSDNGTNFAGADAELRRLFISHTREHFQIAKGLAEARVQWKFIPPGAPHFGGLWEAAVKSTKFHLRRVMGKACLTFEELSTLLTQIEACLNSRPLCALSDDPHDLGALTPGHFLVGTALTALPEPTLLDTQVSQLTRWQLLTQMRDHFWSRWSREYLQGLLPRPKWQCSVENIAVGRLCLITDGSGPPTSWPLARVTKTHAGSDGKVRVVTVKTASSQFVRPITKLVLLPTACSNPSGKDSLPEP